MSVTVSEFATHQGKRVDQFHLVSDTGVEVDIIGYGISVRDWRVPVSGGMRSVVLGFEEFAPYPTHGAHFGAVAGRVANRIRGASFDLDGDTYDLPVNQGTWHLHGGPEGLGHQVWTGEPDDSGTAVRFSHLSPDGAMGYPGTVRFETTYSLKGNTLRLEFSATTDTRTPISLVQHQYFNLGQGKDVLDHTIQVDSSAYTAVGEDLIPTGAILPSRGTRYDLRKPRTMRDDTGQPVDYDMGLVLDSGRDRARPVATGTAPEGDLTLKLWTDQPGLQVYNAVWTDIATPGLGGKRYGKHSGFCLEDQALADAVHHPHFPAIICDPDHPYAHWCEIEIG